MKKILISVILAIFVSSTAFAAEPVVVTKPAVIKKAEPKKVKTKKVVAKKAVAKK